MRKEDTFLLSLCHQVLDSRFELSFELSDGDINYNYLINNAERHRIESLLYNYICKNNYEHLFPLYWIKKMSERYYFTHGSNLLIYQESQRIINLLSKENIQCILFKGILSTELLYPKVLFRIIGDIDIFIDSRDLKKILEVFTSSGYDVEKVRLGVINLINLTSKIKIDLHWYIHFFNKGIKQFEKNLRWKFVHGNLFPTFSLEDQLLHLCIHLAINHRFNNLLNLLEICLLINKNRSHLNWVKFLEQNEQLKTQSISYFVLYFLHKMFEIKIPRWIISKLQPSQQRQRTIFKKISNCDNYISLKHCSNLDNLDTRMWKKYIDYLMSRSLFDFLRLCWQKSFINRYINIKCRIWKYVRIRTSAT